MGHVIGFAHDDNLSSIMYGTDSNVYPKEYGIVDFSTTMAEGGVKILPICTSRDQTNFNYHVSTTSNSGDEVGVDVYFITSIEDFENFLEGEDVNPFYPGCSSEDMVTINAACNNVGKDSALLIIMPEETTELLTNVDIMLQENFGNTQTISSALASQEAPLIPASAERNKLELLEVSEIEAEYESVFLDGTDYLEITDTTLTQDIDEFSIVGWIKPELDAVLTW